MSKPKFTPGPWGFAIAAPYNFNGESLAIVDQNARAGESVPVVCIITKRETQNERDTANARLISAAPDLFAALEKAVADYGRPGGPWSVPSEPGTWIAMATEALKKARGE